MTNLEKRKKEIKALLTGNTSMMDDSKLQEKLNDIYEKHPVPKEQDFKIDISRTENNTPNTNSNE